MNTGRLSLAVMFAVPALGSPQEFLSVESPRPLAEAVIILEQKYGWPIDYEDPPYADPGDLVDKTDPSYRGPWRAIDPRSGVVEIVYSISPLTGKPTDPPEVLLQRLVDDHVHRGNPGRFQIMTIDDRHSVIPAQGSILDTLITLPERQYTYHEALQEILQAVSRAIGILVRDGEALGQPRFDRFQFGATGEPASNVLRRLFQTRKGYWFSWQLRYAPMWGYVLSTRAKAPPAELEPSAEPQVIEGVHLPDGSRSLKRQR